MNVPRINSCFSTTADMPDLLFEQSPKNGNATHIKLNQNGTKFFRSDNDNEADHRYALAKSFVPVIEQHHERLKDDLRVVEARKAKSRVPKTVARLRKEVVFSPAILPLILVALCLFGIISFGCFAELSTANEIVRESSLFERPASDPRLPAVEPEAIVAIAFAFAPIFGFLLSIEFVFRVIKERGEISAKILAFGSLVLALLSTVGFPYVVLGISSENELTTTLSSATPPWQSFALNMVVLALMNSMAIQLLIRLTKYCFEQVPSTSKPCMALNNELTHLLECTTTTITTLGILQAAIEKGDKRQERRSLTAQLNSLDN